ncbi:MAG: UDP-N-acetylmuramate dehydrogenase [Bacteroidales bacterium]|nr:UDP-N-acetylmuramate dehydrogenase [Bacteroidales bacterium]
MEVKEKFSLKKYNTFGIDVSARYFVELNSVDEIMEFLKTEKFKKIPKLILGAGSNILFTKDFDGIVIKINNKGIDILRKEKDFIFIKAAAGEVWSDFVNYCLEKKYGGIENLSLIYGNVGSGAVQNIGAYGVEIKDTLHEINAVNIETHETKRFSKAKCKFGYRDSIFKSELKNKFIIISVAFKLTRNNHLLFTKYGSIEKELESMKVKEPDIFTISKAVCNIRKRRLPNPEEIGNGGSFFKNPFVDKNTFSYLQMKYPGIPYFEAKDNKIKIFAGWLIEQAGLKGIRIGDAGVHKEQALVLVNYGNAKGSEILELAKKIQKTVFEKFKISLELEINVI